MASLAAARGGGESGGGGVSKEGGASPGAAAPSSSSSSTLLLSGAELQAADAARLHAVVALTRSALDACRDEAGRLELRLRRLRLDVAEASAGLREVAAVTAGAATTTTTTNAAFVAAAKTSSSSSSTTAPSSASTPRQLQLVLSPAAARVAELEGKLRACEATLDGDSARQRLYELLEERTR